MNLEPLVVAAAGGDVDAFGRLVSATSTLVSSCEMSLLRSRSRTIASALMRSHLRPAWSHDRTSQDRCARFSG